MKLLVKLAAIAVLALPAAAQAAPDLTGVWSIVGYSPALKTLDGKAPPLKPDAQAVYAKHVAAAAKGDRAFDGAETCLPEGLPRLMLGKKPFEIIQRPRGVYFVHQNRLAHTAYFNEALPADPDPFYLGYSVAKWDGDTLVVDSTGFRDSTLMDDRGLPHSEALRLTERYTLGKGGKTLTVRTTVTDPNTFTSPWSFRATYARKPAGFQIPEEICAEKRYGAKPKA